MKVSKVTAENRYLRICVFGRESVGKTHFALSGPGEVLVFDKEGRVAAMADTPGIKPFSRVDYDERNVVADFVEAATEVRTGNTPFRTFALDSWTDFELAVDRIRGFETRLQTTNATKTFELADKRQYLERSVLSPALTGPTRCHLVVTAHEKNAWAARTSGGGAETIGKDPDGTRNLSHYFDLVFHMQIDPKTRARTAVVKKSNYQSVFAIGQVVPNLCWQLFTPIINRQVAVDEITNESVLELFTKAGYDGAARGKWLAENGFQQRDNKWNLTAADKHRAAGLLRTEIEEKEAIPA
jgi:hypothetical protein